MKKFIPAFLLSVLSFVLFFFFVRHLSAFSRELKVIACDVGQGDATLVLYDQLTVLIDTGPNSGIKRCLQANISAARPTIDLLVLTHDDADHIGGFSEVIRSYRVRHMLVNPKIKNTKVAQSVLDWMDSQKGNDRAVLHPRYGDELYFPGLKLIVLWSERGQEQLRPGVDPETGSNENSIAVFIEAESFGFFEAGDLACTQELAVSSSPLLKKVRLLKMSHHGSKTSSCLEYLEKIRPEAAYYSAGEGNTYGHPDPSSLENIRRVSPFVVGTDQAGEISFAWKNRLLFFQPKKEWVFRSYADMTQI